MEGGGTVNPVSSGQPSSILGGGTSLKISNRKKVFCIAIKQQSRDEKIEESMHAPIRLNTDIDMSFPLANNISKGKQYKCWMCGNSWDSPKTHFSKSAHPKYQANDGYIEICNSCRDRYYKKLIDFYSGNEEHAIRHMCMEFGWVYHVDALTASRQISADRSRISHYLAKKNLGQTARIGTTYFDSMKYEYNEKLDDIVESREQAKTEGSTISASAVDRWGVGFTEADYKNLDDHYRMLKKNNPNCDNNQEIFIKSLCNINMLMVRALKDGDSDRYVKLTEQYAKTFKNAGLKTIEEKDSSNDEVVGVTLATISQYTPEEFYKDKTLYEDWDSIGEYFDRHVRRPMQNLMTGTDIRDKEYFVPENSEDDE